MTANNIPDFPLRESVVLDKSHEILAELSNCSMPQKYHRDISYAERIVTLYSNSDINITKLS